MTARDSISPAAVIAAHLRQEEHDNGTGYEVYTGTMPPTGQHNIALYDTSGRIDNHSQHDGTVYEHCGFQVRIAAPTYAQGYEKAKSLMDALVALSQQAVEEDELDYTIHCITITSSIMSIGQASPSRAAEFTFNGLLSFSAD